MARSNARTKTKAAGSPAVADFTNVIQPGPLPAPVLRAGRLHLNPENGKNGLARLVLILVKLLHELLEKQALRRVESGSLTASQIERLGITLLRQAQELERLRKELGFAEEDLNLDLGPLGKLL